MNPDSDLPGFHVSRLDVPDTDMKLLVANSRKTAPEEKRAFFNKDLGLDYLPEGAGLTIADLRRTQRDYACVSEYRGDNPVTMGVDVASERALNVRVTEWLTNGTWIALFIGEVASFEELQLFMDRYRVNVAFIDSQPDGRSVRKFLAQFPGRAYRVIYATGDVRTLVEIDIEHQKAAVARTDVMDAVADLIRDQRNLLPRDLPAGYEQQMQSPLRVLREDAFGQARPRYEKRGADDYYHAEGYALAAYDAYLFTRNYTVLSQPFEIEFDDETTYPYDDPDPPYSPGPKEDNPFNS